MAAPADLDPLPDRLTGRVRCRGLHHRVGQGLQIVLLILGRTVREADHLPADGHGHPVGMGGAQVVAVRFDVGGERAENRRGVAVDVGERVHGSLLARGPAAATRTQRPASLTTAPTAGERLPRQAGSRRALTTADGIDPRAVTPSPRALGAIVSRLPPAAGRPGYAR